MNTFSLKNHSDYTFWLELHPQYGELVLHYQAKNGETGMIMAISNLNQCVDWFENDHFKNPNVVTKEKQEEMLNPQPVKKLKRKKK